MNTTTVFLAIIIAGILTITFIEGKSVSAGKLSFRENTIVTMKKICRIQIFDKRKCIVPIILRVGNETTTATEITESATQEAVTEDDSGKSTGIEIISISLICFMALIVLLSTIDYFTCQNHSILYTNYLTR